MPCLGIQTTCQYKGRFYILVHTACGSSRHKQRYTDR